MDYEKLRRIMEPDIIFPYDFECFVELTNSFHPELKKALEEYLRTDTLPDFEYKGWTIEKIMNHTHLSAILSFEKMHTLMEKPEYCERFGNMCFGKK